MKRFAILVGAAALLLMTSAVVAQDATVLLREAPAVLESVPPVYPELAREARIQGVVILEVTTLESGAVSKVRVRKGLPIGLSDAAAEAVKTWLFEAPKVDGTPSAAVFPVRVTFRLS